MTSFHDIFFSTKFKNGSTTANSDFRMHTESDRTIDVVFKWFMLEITVLEFIIETTADITADSNRQSTKTGFLIDAVMSASD